MSGEWLTRYDQLRERFRELGEPEFRLNRLAWDSLLGEWHRKHGKRGDPRICSGCGKPVDSGAVLLDGGGLHENDACLYAYGRKWREEAERELALIGVTRPEMPAEA